MPGAQLPGVHYLRTIADADALAAAAAASATSVAVIAPSAVPLERVLGREIGEVYRDLHARHGVDLRLGEGVAALRGGRQVDAMLTTTGTRIDADLVVADEYLRTSHPNVFAAGDVAAAWHPVFGARMRVEHWANAVHQGATAAANMLDARQPWTQIPYFFSDQYDLGTEYTGHCPDPGRVVVRGDPGSGGFIAFWLRDGIVAAAVNANVRDVNGYLQQLVRDRVRVPVEHLADPGVPVQSLLPAQPGATTPE